MNKNPKLLLVIVTVFLLASSIQVECRRTYSSRSSSSGRGNRGKNQPSGGGIFSSWFGGSKSGSSSSGSVSKPAPTSAKKNWQTATGHATSQSKSSSSSNWANPYYKPSGSAPLPSAPKEPNYGWKPVGNANAKPINSYPSSSLGSRGYPVQGGMQPGTQTNFGGYKPAPGMPNTNYQPPQTGFGGYRSPPSVPNAPATSFQQPSRNQNNYGYHSSLNHNSPHPSHNYQPSLGVPHQPSYHHSGAYPQQPAGHPNYHSSYSGYSPHASFGGALPTYQGAKLFGGSSGHYGYPGSGSWGIDTYGARKSSGTGKLLTGLAVGAAGGYLTSSLVNSISNPWKYSGWGYGSRYGYGSGYDIIRSRDESAFERGYERGVQARLNENNSNKETIVSPQPEDPTSKWIQCVAFDPQTQQTLINPNCSCTVTTSVDERTGQPISVHQCSTLNGLVMQPIPVQPSPGLNLPISLSPVNGQTFAGENQPPIGGVNAPGAVPSYGSAYEGNIQYGGGPTIYLPSQTEARVGGLTTDKKPESSDKSTIEIKTEQMMTELNSEQTLPESQPKATTNSVTEREVTTAGKVTNSELVTGEGKTDASLIPENLGSGVQSSQKRTAEFYGQLQKIVNMGSFVDGN